MRKNEENSGSRSKRRYPERMCANHACEAEKKFIPHDRRQRFCCLQCRVNFHNDKRHLTNNTKLVNEKLLREYDKKLHKIFTRLADKAGYCAVSVKILEYESINLRLCVEDQTNPQTGGKVKWLYNYGTEQHPDNKNYFIIHKKK